MVLVRLLLTRFGLVAGYVVRRIEVGLLILAGWNRLRYSCLAMKGANGVTIKAMACRVSRSAVNVVGLLL